MQGAEITLDDTKHADAASLTAAINESFFTSSTPW